MGHTDVSLSRVILVSVPLMPLQCAALPTVSTTTFPLHTLLSKSSNSYFLRGGIFSRSLVFQAFSHVMVIIDEVSTLQRGPFANSGPHPATSPLDFPIIRQK